LEIIGEESRKEKLFIEEQAEHYGIEIRAFNQVKHTKAATI